MVSEGTPPFAACPVPGAGERLIGSAHWRGRIGAGCSDDNSSAFRASNAVDAFPYYAEGANTGQAGLGLLMVELYG